jgi:hypothetical protein
MVTTFIPDVKGWYLIKFVLNDGKADGWPALSFIEIGNRDPVADGGPDRTVAVGDRVDVDCYASTDPEGDALECAWWVDGPDGSLYPLYLPDGTTSTNTYGPEAYFTPDVAGTYEVRLRVTDEDGVRDGYGGVDRVTFFVTALPDNYPPEITSLPVETATQGELYEYDVAASDPDGEDALVYSLAHAPDGMDINAGTGAIQWNVLPEHLGAYDVTVRVEDPAGLSDEQSYAIAVNDVNFAPAITSSPLQSATPGLGYRYDVDASDPDPDDNLVFSLDVFPEEMHIDSLTGLILWTPGPDQVGTQTITLRVEDGSGLFDLQGFAVEVSSHAPVLTSSPISTAVEYAQYLYDVEAMDEDAGDRLRYSLDDAPAGMDINSVSGEIQWTPAARWNNGESQTGNYPVTVRVEDLGGQFDVQSFTIQVSESAPGVRISVSKDSLQIPASLTDALVYYISFETSVPAPCTLTFDQTVTPDTGGLTLGETSVSWEVETTSQRVYTQLIEAHTAGTYEITATVTESATGTSAQTTVQVEVIDGKPLPFMSSTGSYPDAVPIGVSKNVVFTNILAGENSRPTSIVLEQIDELDNVTGTMGPLVDNGSFGDLVANDGAYSGTYTIRSDSEQVLRFRTRAVFPGSVDAVVSDPCKILATRFPTEIRPWDGVSVATDPESGAQFVSDTVLVSFAEGTGPDQIESIAVTVGGTVVGTMARSGYYQVGIPDSGDHTGVLSAIDVLQAHPSVDNAEPDLLGHLNAVLPDDPDFGWQDYLERIEAHHAWLASKGTGMIAVIDSGVDDYHPDLAGNPDVPGKLIMGRNYFCNTGLNPECEYDPYDEHAHGTMMAGVASAITNNNIGIAGTSPDGFLMPIKACTPPQSANVDLCPVSHVVRAINFATDRGARIISMSIGYARQDLTNLQKSSIRRSCDRANRRGALVLTSAGNANSPGAEYPAAFRSVVGVGGTMQDVFTTLPGGGMPEIRWDETSLGAPDEGSNYGEGVELAAPAQHIHMTAPTYETDFYAWEQCVDPATQRPLSLIRRQQEGCYISASGTSPSTAIVAGVADLVRGRFSDISVDDLRYRLSATATRLPGQELGSGMVNAYEAVLNGSFEGEGHVPYGLREAVADYAD